MSRYLLLKNEGVNPEFRSMPKDEAEDFIERAVSVYDKVIELEEKNGVYRLKPIFTLLKLNKFQ